MLKSLSAFCLLALAPWAHAQDYLVFTRTEGGALSTQILVVPIAADGTFSYVSPYYASHPVDAEAKTTSDRVRVGYELSGTVTQMSGNARSIALTEGYSQVTDWTLDDAKQRFLATINHISVKTTVVTRPETENILNAGMLTTLADGKRLVVHETISLINEQDLAHW